MGVDDDESAEFVALTFINCMVQIRPSGTHAVQQDVSMRARDQGFEIFRRGNYSSETWAVWPVKAKIELDKERNKSG